MGRVNASGAAEEMRLSDYCDGSDQSSLTLSKSISTISKRGVKIPTRCSTHYTDSRERKFCRSLNSTIAASEGEPPRTVTQG